MARTVYIADATTLLGRACAVRLGRAGWNIIMGASSLSRLESICNELPDFATCAHRCDPTDIDNIRPVMADGLRQFGSLNAVLMNYRPDRAATPETLEGYVTALTNISDVTRPYLDESKGSFVVVGQRMGKRTMDGAMQTMTRNAARTLSAALYEDWHADDIRVSLVEPDGVDGPKPMARRITRVLNGAPARRSLANIMGAAQTASV